MNEITIEKKNDGWAVTFHGHAATFETFGTYTVESGWASTVSASEVFAELQPHYPECLIREVWQGNRSLLMSEGMEVVCV